MTRRYAIMHVDIHEAETTLSTLIDKAKAGEEIIIQKDDTEVQLVPKPQPLKEPRKLGLAPNIKIAEDFDEWPDDFAFPFGKAEE
jgi:antitoxin (DNA-binding transcriptional repressor) of toxin-antitoxin stability system